MGAQGGPQNPQKSEKKSSKSPPKCLLGCYFKQTLKKHRKFMILGYPGTLQMRLGLKREHRFHFWHRSLKRYQKDLKNAPFWAPFGHPGRPNAAFGPFRGQPKISCFFGRVSMLTLARKWLQNEQLTDQLFWTFLGPFSRGYPPP